MSGSYCPSCHVFSETGPLDHYPGCKAIVTAPPIYGRIENEVSLSAPDVPTKGETCRITIETKDMTYVWEGRFWDADWEQEYVDVSLASGKTEFIPTDQHLRLHLVKP